MNRFKSLSLLIALVVLLLCSMSCGGTPYGCIQGNCINGPGAETYPDGEKYIGEFWDSRPNGQGTYTFPNGKKYIVSKTLKEYEEMLSDYNFFRIHKSHLINLNEIKEYVRGDGGYVVMNNEKALDVSKRRKESFMMKITQMI